MASPKSMTKAMLIDENNALRNELNVVRAAYQAERALNAERKINEQFSAPKMPVNKAPMPQWQVDRAKAMAAARSLAMTTGRMIKA